MLITPPDALAEASTSDFTRDVGISKSPHRAEYKLWWSSMLDRQASDGSMGCGGVLSQLGATQATFTTCNPTQ